MPADRNLIAAVAARLLADRQRVLVGVGLPNVAANLAKRLHAPGLVLVYESGVIDARPSELPLSIGDPALVEDALAMPTMSEFFRHYLQPGWIDVGFLGGAQIDRRGNLNSTVIGDYARPRVRLSGSGGAADIAALARRTIVLMPHERHRFPERVDFVTSPGHPPVGLRPDGGGPWRVVTDLGLFGFGDDGEMELMALMPGHTVDDVRAATGWPIRVRPDLGRLEPPTPAEEAVLAQLLASGGGAE